MKHKGSYTFLLLLGLIHVPSYGRPLETSVNKIYTPYVQQLENEIEFQLVIQEDTEEKFDDIQHHKIAYGQALNDKWFLEGILLGVNDSDHGFNIDGYEIELKRQLTEQGEYDNDWGLLFEIERERHADVWEFGATLIALHEFRNWTGLVNVGLIFESGSSIKSRFETELSAQLKYRYRSWFEPAIEFFKSDSVNAAGPSFAGRIRLGAGKSIFWNTAALISFDRSKPDAIYRFNIEYEF